MLEKRFKIKEFYARQIIDQLEACEDIELLKFILDLLIYES